MAVLYESLQHMPNKKVLGTDCFPTGFYEDFWTTLVPTFYRMVIQIRESQTLSLNINSANISLLLKPGKDPHYHPISLINTNLKIICKNSCQKTREKNAPCLIHPNQAGFIKGTKDHAGFLT